jgi:glycosyltransferase involved in cell wall biosynthesis
VRILLVHNYYQQRGGEDVVVEHELDLLRRMGHDVELFSVDNRSIRGLRQIAAGLLVVYNPWARARLAKRLAEFRPDIVHVHNFFPRWSPSIFDACREARVPCVMTLHNFRILCPTSVLFHAGKLCERSLTHSAMWAVPQKVYRSSTLATLSLACMVDFHKWAGTWRRKVDLFIALTDFAKAKFVEGGLPAERIVVKGNAIADPGVGTSPEARRGALYVGRLSSEKGIATLLEAWRGIDYPLRIAGEGPLQDTCKAAEGKNIRCLGRLDRQHVYEEMSRAAFLVLPSTCYEMFPMTLVEAFAHGLPVLASKLGGLGGLVDDGVTGLAFKPGDVVDLRTKARWAAEHPVEMANMGRQARSTYEASYTAERNYAHLMAAYERVLSEPQS